MKHALEEEVLRLNVNVSGICAALSQPSETHEAEDV